MRYKGLTYLGTGKTVGLYGYNDDIVDQKGTGLQSLYIDDYKESYIHTSATAVLVDDELIIAGRIYRKNGHALRKETKSSVENGYRMIDTINHNSIEKIDSAEMISDTAYLFTSTITNISNANKDIVVSALCITENYGFEIERNKKDLKLSRNNKSFTIYTSASDKLEIYIESPTGFMHRTTESFFYNLSQYDKKSIGDHSLGIKNYVEITLEPNETYVYKWVIETDSTKEKYNFNDINNTYWEARMHKIKDNEELHAPMVALMAANLNGFIPADLTSHYFTDGGEGHASFYVRDSLMASRAFLYSGYYDEFEKIINRLISYPLKENNEFFQRYDPWDMGNEGANNNVLSQIDSIGYFTRVVSDYYLLTGKMLPSDKYLLKILNPLLNANKKFGLYGPEGGVNEGVYGPAYITSSNMFIASGLKGIVKYLKDIDHKEYELYKEVYETLVEAIEDKCYSEETNSYHYGYVTYHDDLVNRYDTPQLLATSLGYPISNHIKNNYKYLKEYATYFDWGFGYSEQEYHDGPWIFNTAGAAQTSYLLDKHDDYKNIISWLKDHQNGYGLLPEAIWATEENRTHINPLMWGNSEFVCALLIDKIQEVRKLEEK